MMRKFLVLLCALVFTTQTARAQITYEFYEFISYDVSFDAVERSPEPRVHLWAQAGGPGGRSIGDWYRANDRFLGFQIDIGPELNGPKQIIRLAKAGARTLPLYLSPGVNPWTVPLPIGTFHSDDDRGTEVEAHEGETIALGRVKLSVLRLTPTEATVLPAGSEEPLKLSISPAAPARAEFRRELQKLKSEHERAERNRWDSEADEAMRSNLLGTSLGLFAGLILAYLFIATGLLTLDREEPIPRRRRSKVSPAKAAKPK